MTFEEAVREAAHRAEQAVSETIDHYSRGGITEEEDITGTLGGQLGARLRGQIAGLTWDTTILRRRRGRAAEEKRIGADMIIHVQLDAGIEHYSKGVLIQSKRIERGASMSADDHADLVGQCNKMLAVTPESFVFDYTTRDVRCGAAARIVGRQSRNLYSACNWTSYRFFLELFQSRTRKFEQDAKWSFCLTAGTIGPRIRRDHEQTTAPEPHLGLQGEGGACRRQGRPDDSPTGRAL